MKKGNHSFGPNTLYKKFDAHKRLFCFPITQQDIFHFKEGTETTPLLWRGSWRRSRLGCTVKRPAFETIFLGHKRTLIQLHLACQSVFLLFCALLILLHFGRREKKARSLLPAGAVSLLELGWIQNLYTSAKLSRFTIHRTISTSNRV
jgi:hypothetical protein